jgi:hypothetical protein
MIAVEASYRKGMGDLGVEKSVSKAPDRALESRPVESIVLCFLPDPDRNSPTTRLPKNLEIIAIEILGLKHSGEVMVPEDLRDPLPAQTTESPKRFSPFAGQNRVGISLQQRFIPSDLLPESSILMPPNRDIRRIEDMESPWNKAFQFPIDRSPVLDWMTVKDSQHVSEL